MELSTRSPADHCIVVGGSKDDKARKSRITNGKDLLPNIDGRSVIARRYRDIASAILADQGGEDRCSESRKQLIRRAAAVAVLAEQLEGRLANGEQIDIAEHATLSSTLVRLTARIGIDRVPRDAGGLTLGGLMRLAASTPAEPSDDEPSAGDDEQQEQQGEAAGESENVEAITLPPDQNTESAGRLANGAAPSNDEGGDA